MTSSETNHQRFARTFEAASHTEQALMLLRLAHNLTIGARESYPLANEDLAEAERFAILHDINEVQHRIISHCLSLLTEDERRYPDEVILAMLAPAGNGPENPIVSKWLDWALGNSENSFGAEE